MACAAGLQAAGVGPAMAAPLVVLVAVGLFNWFVPLTNFPSAVEQREACWVSEFRSCGTNRAGGRQLAIRRLAITVGLVILGWSAAPPAMAQNADSFREAPPAPVPRAPHAPRSEQEPVVVPQQPVLPPYDGTWVGVHRCPAFRNRQAFQHVLIMQIKNGRASAVTNAPAGTPGYLTFAGAVASDGKLGLRGYGISRGQPGAAPAGTQFPFMYDGAIAGDSYTARDLGLRPCTIELFRQH